MGAEERVFDGQLFIKTKPNDYTQAIEAAKKELLELKDDFRNSRTRLMNNKNATRRDIIDLNNKFKALQACEEITRMNPIDPIGMEHFWSLSITPERFDLISIPIQKNDVFVVNSYKTLLSMSKYYRSLSDIVSNEEFIGKQLAVSLPEPFETMCGPLILLYDLDYQFIGCFLDQYDNMDQVLVGLKSDSDPLPCIGSSIDELNNPGKMYRLILNQKNRG